MKSELENTAAVAEAPKSAWQAPVIEIIDAKTAENGFVGGTDGSGSAS